MCQFPLQLLKIFLVTCDSLRFIIFLLVEQVWCKVINAATDWCDPDDQVCNVGLLDTCSIISKRGLLCII